MSDYQKRKNQNSDKYLPINYYQDLVRTYRRTNKRRLKDLLITNCDREEMLIILSEIRRQERRRIKFQYFPDEKKPRGNRNKRVRIYWTNKGYDESTKDLEKSHLEERLYIIDLSYFRQALIDRKEEVKRRQIEVKPREVREVKPTDMNKARYFQYYRGIEEDEENGLRDLRLFT